MCFYQSGLQKKVLAAYVHDQDVSNPLLSPVNGNVGMLPPVLLQHGTNDILVPGSGWPTNWKLSAKLFSMKNTKACSTGLYLPPGFRKLKWLSVHR